MAAPAPLAGRDAGLPDHPVGLTHRPLHVDPTPLPVDFEDSLALFDEDLEVVMGDGGCVRVRVRGRACLQDGETGTHSIFVLHLATLWHTLRGLTKEEAILWGGHTHMLGELGLAALLARPSMPPVTAAHHGILHEAL